MIFKSTKEVNALRGPKFLMIIKVFARKLIPMTFDVSGGDIEEDAKVGALLSLNGGHKNVIKTLRHGWFQHNVHVYYIDMELADLTLKTYINYLNGGSHNGIDFEKLQFSSIFVHSKCPLPEKLQNMWTIGTRK